jgi:hypothetical protein
MFFLNLCYLLLKQILLKLNKQRPDIGYFSQHLFCILKRLILGYKQERQFFLVELIAFSLGSIRSATVSTSFMFF